MVATMNIDNHDVNHMFIDNGSFVDILFYETLLKMNISPAQLEGTYTPIKGFLGELVSVEGTFVLPVIAGQAPC